MSGAQPERGSHQETGGVDVSAWMHPHAPAYRWYGWDSPVGLGLFILLIALAIVVGRYAFH